MPKTLKKQPAGQDQERPTLKKEVDAIVDSLKHLGDRRTRDEMSSRYGIHLPDPNKAFGVKMAAMQKVAREARQKDAPRNHELAAALWKSGWYEARMVACMVDEAELVTSAQMDAWCRDFDNWGICDTVCFKLFDQVDPALAFRKVAQWAKHKDEFIRRGGFALLACLALHRKELDDEPFATCLPLIERAADDERNFVKKAISWALRGMAMRGKPLHSAVVGLAQQLADSDNSTRRWIGKDVLRQIKKR